MKSLHPGHYGNSNPQTVTVFEASPTRRECKRIAVKNIRAAFLSNGALFYEKKQKVESFLLTCNRIF